MRAFPGSALPAYPSSTAASPENSLYAVSTYRASAALSLAGDARAGIEPFTRPAHRTSHVEMLALAVSACASSYLHACVHRHGGGSGDR